MFSQDTATYPFHAQATYQPKESDRSADPLADYMQHMQNEGIDRAILVHPEPYGDDHSLVLDCLQREPDLFWGTSLFYPKDPDGPEKLHALVKKQPKIISTRFHAHRTSSSYLDSFDDAGVRALWAAAAELGLIVELHIGPNYAAQTATLIQSHPDTLVLIDHLAEPHMGNAVEYADVLALSRFDNVYMKLSGLNHFADDAPLYPSAKDFTQLVVDAFGADRMVWGSGSPRIVDLHLEHLSAADRDKVKGGNLEALLMR